MQKLTLSWVQYWGHFWEQSQKNMGKTVQNMKENKTKKLLFKRVSKKYKKTKAEITLS
jgi:hypothetical protein